MRLVPVAGGFGVDVDGHGEFDGGLGRVSMTWRAVLISFSVSASLTSNTSSSCTCSSIRADEAWLCQAPVVMRIMARRMMSAAEPWIGALMAARSRNPRIDGFLVLISG